MKRFKRLLIFIAVVVAASFFMTLVSSAAYEETTLNNAIKYKGAELTDPIDGMWQGMKVNNDNGGALESNQQGITGDGSYIKFDGYQSGGNVQYAYQDIDELHNKLIKFKLKFDGELVDPEASFITLVFRAAGFSSKFFWDDSCYIVLIKGGKVEANKFPSKVQGVNNSLGGTKGNIPIVKKLDTPFKPGTYDIEVGALDGKSPKTNTDSVNLILKINGKEAINVWDDSGRTPIIKRKGYFMISMCYTQAGAEGSSDSKSSVTIYQASSEKATPAPTASATPAPTASATPVTVEPTGTPVVTAEPTKSASPEAMTTTPEESAAPTLTDVAAESNATESTAAASANTGSNNENKSQEPFKFPWIIVVAVIVVLIGAGVYVFGIRKK